MALWQPLLLPKETAVGHLGLEGLDERCLEVTSAILEARLELEIAEFAEHFVVKEAHQSSDVVAERTAEPVDETPRTATLAIVAARTAEPFEKGARTVQLDAEAARTATLELAATRTAEPGDSVARIVPPKVVGARTAQLTATRTAKPTQLV